MKNADEEELYDEYDHSSTSYAWWAIPEFVKWLKGNRDNEKEEVYAINLTIILHSATLLEGFIYQLLVEECGTPSYNKDIDDRLLIELNKRLENASWKNYQELFILIIGKKLSDFTNQKNWKSINMLFQLRNSLTHGKSIELKFYNKYQREPVISGKNKTIYNYFKEIKLIDVNSKEFLPGAVEFVTSESADYFFSETLSLIDTLYLKIGKSDEYQGLIADAYEWVFEK